MRRSKACRLQGRLKDTLLSARMQVAIFLSARHLLTRFQGRSLVYTLEGPSQFVLGMPNPEYQDLLSYVSPVTTEWHSSLLSPTFRVMCEDHIFPVRAWFLPSGEDGTRVSLDANLIFVTADKTYTDRASASRFPTRGLDFFQLR
jgi:hypothetical protein